MSDDEPSPSAQSQTPILIGELAILRFEGRVGEHEDGPKNNQGALVIEMCRRWVHTEEDWIALYESGKCAWCIGAVSSMFDDVGSQAIKGVGSLSCTTFYERSKKHGYVIPLEELRRGDVLLTDRDRNGQPNHGTLCRENDKAAGLIRVVAGNSGPGSRFIWKHDYEAIDPTLFAAIRIPC